MQGADIAALLPHGDAMCLIERVCSCSATQIHCQVINHQQPDHPLREAGALPAMSLVEYGAQAAGIHAALNQSVGGRPAEGYIGGIKGLELHCQSIDCIATPIDIRAECELTSANGAIYRFSAEAAGELLATGRLTLIHPQQSAVAS